MARTFALAALLLVGLVASCRADSDLTFKFEDSQGLDPASGFRARQAKNTALKRGAIGKPEFSASLFKVTLPPCGVRAPHIHKDVHEMHYVTKGQFLAMGELDGETVYDALSVGDTFISPMNTEHALMNPSCTDDAEFLAFYTNISPETVPVDNSPTFEYSSECIQRCNLYAKKGQDYSKTYSI